VRYLPLHPGTAELVIDYLETAGHGGETAATLFRPVKNNTGGTVPRTSTPTLARTMTGIGWRAKPLTGRLGGARGIDRTLCPDRDHLTGLRTKSTN